MKKTRLVPSPSLIGVVSTSIGEREKTTVMIKTAEVMGNVHGGRNVSYPTNASISCIVVLNVTSLFISNAWNVMVFTEKRFCAFSASPTEINKKVRQRSAQQQRVFRRSEMNQARHRHRVETATRFVSATTITFSHQVLTSYRAQAHGISLGANALRHLIRMAGCDVLVPSNCRKFTLVKEVQKYLGEFPTVCEGDGDQCSKFLKLIQATKLAPNFDYETLSHKPPESVSSWLKLKKDEHETAVTLATGVAQTRPRRRKKKKPPQEQRTISITIHLHPI